MFGRRRAQLSDPGTRSGRDVVAVSVSDVHLSERPPAARSQETDWFAAMRRTLEQVDALTAAYRAPLLIAGDIFHKWNPCPELINFALDYLPTCYAVPGQHDLPYHRLDLIHRSAYWNLVKHGKIINLESGRPYTAPNITLWGFPWGVPPRPCLQPVKEFNLHVAVVHSYVWVRGRSYAGAPEERRLRAYSNSLEGYEIAIFGDNHKGFITRLRTAGGKVVVVINNGGLFRRHTDEVDYQPKATLLHADGTATRVPLDCSRDVLLGPDRGEGEMEEEGLSEFLEELSRVGVSSEDFTDALRRRLGEGGVSEAAREMIVGWLEDGK